MTKIEAWIQKDYPAHIAILQWIQETHPSLPKYTTGSTNLLLGLPYFLARGRTYTGPYDLFIIFEDQNNLSIYTGQDLSKPITIPIGDPNLFNKINKTVEEWTCETK